MRKTAVNDDVPLPDGPTDGDPYGDEHERGWLRVVTPDEDPIDVLPGPGEPLAVARELLAEMTDDSGTLLLRRWRGEWWQYQGPHWEEAEGEAIRKLLYERLENAGYSKYNPATKAREIVPWSPDKSKVDRLADAMAAPTLLSRNVDAPTWLSTGESAAGVVPCLNGLVDVHARTIQPMTPDYFGTVCVPFAYDPDSPTPAAWLDFLHTLWPEGDGAEIDALQEWMGYVLSGRLDLQKIMLMVGPPRCGKGTIARILQALVGPRNVAAPTLAGLATNFGLQPLIGKPLGVVGDARLAVNGQEAVVERLLSISGQDSITIDRKNLTAWTGTLPTRIMVLSNELPKFGDASAAIASRFVVLTFQETFLGKEDIGLESRLRAELPAILKWALEGLVRLQGAGRLTEPPASAEMVQMLHDIVSPIRAFVREACVVDDPDRALPFSTLYREYQEWCTENHRGVRNTAGFSSDLQAALPHIRTDYRPKVDGRKQPRHVQGVGLSPDWTGRVRDTGAGAWGRAA